MPAVVQRKAAPAPQVPAPCGGRVGPAAIQRKAAPAPQVPAPCGGRVGPAAAQRKAPVQPPPHARVVVQPWAHGAGGARASATAAPGPRSGVAMAGPRRSARGKAHGPAASVQRKTGTIIADPSEVYLYDPSLDESFSIRGGLQIPGGSNVLYVIDPTASQDVAIVCDLYSNATTIEMRARDNGEVIGRFRFKRTKDNSDQGASLWLSHMNTTTKYLRQGVAETLLRAAVNKYGVFRIGTEPNVEFFQPVDPEDEIALTEDGDNFITGMMNKGVIDFDYTFPNDHKEKYKKFLEEQGSDEDI